MLCPCEGEDGRGHGDVMDENERTMDVIKGYVEVNDDVENETMKYLGEVWIGRQRNERNRVNVIP